MNKKLKKTLLNSFLNFLMEIKYADKFRYKFILENENHERIFIIYVQP